MRNFFLFSLFIFTTVGCEYFQPKEQSVPVARVGENYLYESDLANLGTEDLSEEDSTKIVNAYIDRWIQKQTLLQNASRNLTQEQLLEVDRKVLEYKESLLSYMYESRISEERVDTMVSQQEIESYYNENQEDFVIEDPIVKFLSIQRNQDFQNVQEINDWINKYEEEGNDADLREFCSFESINCYLNIEQWVSLEELYETLGATGSNNDVALRKNRLFKRGGENYFYLYKLFDVKEEGVYPLEFVEQQIETLILREREQDFLEDLRNQIFERAKNNNEIEVYDE